MTDKTSKSSFIILLDDTRPPESTDMSQRLMRLLCSGERQSTTVRTSNRRVLCVEGSSGEIKQLITKLLSTDQIRGW